MERNKDFFTGMEIRACSIIRLLALSGAGVLALLASSPSDSTTVTATGPKIADGVDRSVVVATVQDASGVPVTNADIQVESVLSVFYGQLSQYSVRLDALNVGGGQYRTSFASPVPGPFGILAVDRVGFSSGDTTVEFLPVTSMLPGPSGSAVLTPIRDSGIRTFGLEDDAKEFFKQLDQEFYPPILIMRINDPATPPAKKAELMQRLIDFGPLRRLLDGDFRLEIAKAAGRDTAAAEAAFKAAEAAAKEAIQRYSTGQITLIKQFFGDPVDFDKFQKATELFNNYDLIAGDLNGAIDRIKMAQMLLKAWMDETDPVAKATKKKAFEDFVKDGVVVRGPDGSDAHIRWAKFADMAIDVGVDVDFWRNLKPIVAKGSAITVSVLDKDKKKSLTSDEIKTIRDMYDPLRPKSTDSDDDKKKKIEQIDKKLLDLIKTIFIDKKTVAQLPGFDSPQTIQIAVAAAGCIEGGESGPPTRIMQPFSLGQFSDGTLFGFNTNNDGLTSIASGTSAGSNVTFLLGGPGLSLTQGLSLAVFSGTTSGSTIAGTVEGMTSGLIRGKPDTCNWSGTFLIQPRLVCDINGDGKVDRNDLNTVFAAHNTPSTSGDPRDADGDGAITVNDVRFCTLRCTNPLCAP